MVKLVCIIFLMGKRCHAGSPIPVNIKNIERKEINTWVISWQEETF